MSVMQTAIEEKLVKHFSPEHLLVENESHQHAGPKNAETHFKVVVVSKMFTGMSRLQRARLVHAALSLELQSGVHALTTREFSPEEWSVHSKQMTDSPDCHGGSKK
jgi:BolA family transcriptional regulator, general stress-responsive regulator